MKISIITAVLNRAATIGEAIDSVRAQTWRNVEHVIQDGGSNDSTLEIARDRAASNALIVSEPDRGIYDAINRGIIRSTGDIIGLMHSDDVYANMDVLSKIAEKFEDKKIDGVYGDLNYVLDMNSKNPIRYWKSGEYNRSLLKIGWMPPHPTLYLRREVFDRLGLYDTSFHISGDYDAILRYLVKGNISLAYIPEVLVKMRIGGESNRSIERIFLKSREDFRAIRNNGVGGIGTLAAKNLLKINQFFAKDHKLA
jgi:glycosyltransferase involved in cell wall biosynthesis